MELYRLVTYGISDTFLIVCASVFLRFRFSRRKTALSMFLIWLWVIGFECARYVLARRGINQRMTMWGQVLGINVLIYLSQYRDGRALFSAILSCVYGACVIMVGKVVCSAGVPLWMAAASTAAVAAVLLYFLIRYLLPSYRRLQETCARPWLLFNLVFIMFLVGTNLLYGALKGVQMTVLYNMVPMVYLLTVCILMVMAFRMFAFLSEEEMWAQAASVLEISKRTLRKEEEEIRRAERKIAEYNHDNRHFVRMLGGMLAEENYQGVKEVLAQVKERPSQLQRKRYCRNLPIDGVIGNYVRAAKEDGISMAVTAELPENLGAYELELAVLLGKLLDDAIHMARKEEKGAGRVCLRIKQSRGQTMFEVRNTCSASMALDGPSGIPVQKDDRRAPGFAAMAGWVEKWGGYMDCGTENGWFFVRILV